MSRSGCLCTVLLACLVALPGACAPRASNPGNVRAANLAQARAMAVKGQKAQADGDLDLAIQCYHTAVIANPDFGAAWNNLGSALMLRAQETDLIAAQQSFQRASDLLPTDPTPNRNLGNLYLSRDFADDALKYYEQALAIDPYDTESLRNATSCIKRLRRADTPTLDLLKRAKITETDPKWRAVMDREYLRVENDLREQRERD